jgi:class 3 adenylate cyclase
VREHSATRYARAADGTYIAYQITGDAGVDLIVVPGFATQLELLWEHAFSARVLDYLASFCRLVIFDKRGTGLSDRTTRPPTLEERMDDLRAVMEEVGSSRAALWVQGEAGATGLLFSATYPERVSALVLAYGAYARFTTTVDYPWGPDAAAFDANIDRVESLWGQGRVYSSFSPVPLDEDFLQHASRMERYSLSPGAVRPNLQLIAETDVRHVLGSITVPTFVLQPSGHGRYLADHIPAARTRALVHGSRRANDVTDDLEQVEEFVTGLRTDRRAPDRVLTTILFTDIVSSTQRTVVEGDPQWRKLIDEHDGITNRLVQRFHGRVVKSTGDGILALFDGPGRAVRCARALDTALRPLGLELRAGLHTGEVELRANDDVAGIAVVVAKRISEQATGGELLVSRTVVDLVAGSGINFEPRSECELKGVPGRWPLFVVHDEATNY